MSVRNVKQDHGANVNCNNSEELTAGLCCWFDVDLQSDGKNLFQYACIKDDFIALEILFLNYKTHIAQYNNANNCSLLHYCAEYNSTQIFELVVTQGEVM